MTKNRPTTTDHRPLTTQSERRLPIVSRSSAVVGRFVKRHTTLLSAVIVGVWALGLYVHILRLPFFRDDMVMLLWLRDMPWGKLWVDATGFPYYRPLSFATLKLSELFLGYSQPQFLHVVNLFFHTANSIMIALLTRLVFNQRGRTLAGLFAGLLYAAYPFTFEIMPTTGPIFQLQAAFFALAASLAYAHWRNSTSHLPPSAPALAAKQRGFHLPPFNRWLYLSLAMALLGSFTCEYSVIIPPMVIATELILWWQQRSTSNACPRSAAKRVQRSSFAPSRPLVSSSPHPLVSSSPCLLIPLSYFAFTALYLATWFAVPKTRSTLPWLWLRDLELKTLYYLQGLTWPLQPIALPLAKLLGFKPLTENVAVMGEWTWPAVAAIALIALIGLVVVFARGKRLAALFFGLAWWGIALAPMWPTLDWDYTSNGPRLHYIPALGAALIWGSAISLLTAKRTQEPGKASAFSAPRLFLAFAMLLVAIAPSVTFLRAQADVALTGGQIIDEVVQATTATPADQPVLVVNFPSWISPAQRTFAMGAEGITFLPGYSDIAELVEINSRQKRRVESVTFTNVWQPWKHTQRFYTPPLNWEDLLPKLHSASRVFQVQYRPDGLRLAKAGNIQTAPAPANILASFEGRISLAGVSHSRQANQLIVTLDWTSLTPIEANWTVFLHVYDSSGALIAQGDGDPLLGLYPLWAWQPGEGVYDMRYVDLPPSLAPGQYSVAVGIYDRDSSARVVAIDPNRQRFVNDAVPLFEFEHK